MTSFNPALGFGATGQGQDDLFQGLSQEEIQEISNSQLSSQIMTFNPSGYHHQSLSQSSNPVYSQSPGDGSVGQFQYQPGVGHSSIPGSPYLHSTNPNSTSEQATVASIASPSTLQDTRSPEPFPVEMPKADLGGYSMSLETQAFPPVMNVNHQAYGGQFTLNQAVQRPELSLEVPGFGNNQSNNQTLYDPTSLNPEHTTSALRSPIVRIETCEDIPTTEGLGRSRSRHSISSRHLSPLGDEHSDEGMWSSHGVDTNTSVPIWSGNIDRGDDGSWIRSRETGQGGISPIERLRMNNGDILSLDEQEEQRERDKKNAVVNDWLTRSSNVSENGDAQPLYTNPTRRPRARSANDINRINQTSFGYLSVPVPGPGAVLNEPSDYDEDEFESFMSGYSGSDNEPISPAVDLVTATRPTYYAPNGSAEFTEGRPWTDSELAAATEGTTLQPASSNEAMMAFGKKAKDVDTASLAATIGSRRRSETDMVSLAETITEMTVGADQDPKLKEKRGFIPGIVNKVMLSRNTSRKRKSSLDPGVDSSALEYSSGAIPSSQALKRNVARPRTPKIDTNISTDGRQSNSVVAAATATIAKAKSVVRSRSKSEIGKPSRPNGLSEMLAEHGGLPGAGMMSPARARTHRPIVRAVKDESDDEDGHGAAVSMDLAVKLDMRIIPNYDGFKHHILQLNPRIENTLLERLVQEQLKRYQRLIDVKRNHENEAPRGRCEAAKYCTATGGRAEFLPPKPSGRQTESAPVIFQVMHPNKQENEHDTDSSAIPAQFPSGIPIPPADRLPAKFECNYCFTAKEFKKPSDWTKHIHEDVQPFTCTFIDCHEPKSFKRKADWVRHENERHRQLESWKCDWADCSHICHRRDNFVHHLVREHGVPEPRVRAARSGGRSPGRSPLTPEQLNMDTLPEDFDPREESVEDYVQRVCERCHLDASKEPETEPCRFCGNICTSWKKLTIHLAKHMEQITLPIIPLVQQVHRMSGDVQNTIYLGSNPTMVPDMPIPVSQDVSSVLYYEEPGDIHEPMVPGMSMLSPNAPSHTSFLNLDLATHPNFGQQQSSPNFLDPNSAYSFGTSYPPAVIPGRSSRASSCSDSGGNFVQSRQGTTYPPTSYDARMMQHATNTMNGNLGLDQNATGQQSGQDEQQQQYYGFNTYGGV